MTEKTLASLVAQLEKLNDSLQAVHVTESEDKPARDEAANVDDLSDAVTDLLGQTKEAISAAEGAVKAAGYPLDLDLARRRLSSAHEQVLKISTGYSDLVAYDHIEKLVLLAKRGSEWPAFVASVRKGLARLPYAAGERQPLTRRVLGRSRRA